MRFRRSHRRGRRSGDPGGRFPPAWRELLKSSIANGLDVESGLHEFVSEDAELIDSRTGTVSSCETCADLRPA